MRGLIRIFFVLFFVFAVLTVVRGFRGNTKGK
jgi:hypothetical protein